MVLEVARTMDHNTDFFVNRAFEKRRKYAPLCDALARALPGWTIRVCDFVIGVKGSLPAVRWIGNLSALGISVRVETDWGIIVVIHRNHGLSRREEEEAIVVFFGAVAGDTRGDTRGKPPPLGQDGGRYGRHTSSSFCPVSPPADWTEYLEEILRGTGDWDKLLKNRFCTGDVLKAGCLEVFLPQISAIGQHTSRKFWEVPEPGTNFSRTGSARGMYSRPTYLPRGLISASCLCERSNRAF